MHHNLPFSVLLFFFFFFFCLLSKVSESWTPLTKIPGSAPGDYQERWLQDRRTVAGQSYPYMPLCIAGDTTSELVCVPVNSWIRYIFLLHMPSTRDKWYSYLHCKLEPQPFGLQGHVLLTKLDLLWQIIKWHWMKRLGFERFCYKLHIWNKFLQFSHFFVAGCLLSCVASYMFTFLYRQIIIYQLRRL